MSKRARVAAEQEMFESFAALLRQSVSRAMERLKMYRPRTDGSGSRAGMMRGAGGVPALPMPPATSYLSEISAGSSSAPDSTPPTASTRAVPREVSSIKPIDVLTIQFVMYYLPLSGVPANHYIRLAQEVVTASVDRVLQPKHFVKVPLSQLCETLVAESTAAVMEATLRDAEEFIDSRGVFGEWLAERMSGGGVEDDDEGDGSDADEGRGWGRGRGGPGDPGLDSAGGGADTGDGGSSSSRISSVDLAGILYAALEFWVRVRDFVHALSRGSAEAHAYPLRPRYARELMLLLHGLAHTTPARAGAATLPSAAEAGRRGGGGGGGGGSARAYAEALAPVKRDPAIKQEPVDVDGGDDEGGERGFDARAMVAAAAATAAASEGLDYDHGDGGAAVEDDASEAGSDPTMDRDTPAGVKPPPPPSTAVESRRRHRRDVGTTVLADVLALSHCRPLPADGSRAGAPSSSGAGPAEESPRLLVPPALQTKARGVEHRFYAMVHARLGVMIARDRLRLFAASAAAIVPPPLTVAQRNTQARLEADRLAASGADTGMGGLGAAIGVPLDYVPDDQYYSQVLAQQHDVVGEDEEILKDEVVDYYLRRQQQTELQRRQQQQQESDRRHGPRRGGASASTPGGPAGPQQTSPPQPLMKPHRYCKVKTGFTWTQYNRTHYDSRTNPPPRMVLWYEFTLFYPALVNTKRDMRNIFRIEDTPKGPQDDYCLLVFSVGPPYEDVAYRIVRKQWDTRRGGVRISFDATGRYKLFFRFSNSNYRR